MSGLNSSAGEKNVNPALIKLILLLSAFFAMLNETSVNVAMSNFMGIFGVSVSTVQWLTSGFMLTMTIVVPITAFIIGRFSTRRIYFFNMALLIAGSVIAGLSPNFWVLLAGRLIQAVGTCSLMSLLMNTVLILTPPAQRGAAMGLVGLVNLFAPAISPTLAGIVVQTIGWRWLFLGLTPLFAALTLMALPLLTNITEPQKDSIDLPSILLSVMAFGGILYGIIYIGEQPAKDLRAFFPLFIGAIGLALFAWRQFSIPKPLLDLRVFKYPMFTLGMAMMVICTMSIFGIVLLSPMFLQQGLGLSVFAAGMILLPGGLLNGVLSLVAGRLYDKIGPKALITIGVLAAILVAFGFSSISATIGIGLFIALHCAFLVAITLINTPAQTNGLNQLPKNLYAHGTAIMITLMQLAGGLGTAIFVTIMSTKQRGFIQRSGASATKAAQGGLVFGFNQAFLFCMFLLIAGLVVSLFIKHSLRAEEKMA